MGNEGALSLTLIDVEGRPLDDPGVTVRFRVDDRPLEPLRNLRFVPPHATRRFSGLPAFPQGKVLRGRVSPTRYRAKSVGFFTLTDGETRRVTLKLVRKAEAWSAKFTPWTALSSQFSSLQRLLHQSPDIRVRGGPRIPLFASEAYDAVPDRTTEYAKACLLNLYYKMSRLRDPTAAPIAHRWFTYVDRLIEIRRDRFIAVVQEAMGDAVRAIRADIRAFPDYEPAGAGNHHGNMPHALFRVPKSTMFGIKSSEDVGNLQLSLAPATEVASGKRVLLLDADIDEKGRLFEHLLEVLGHKVAGKKTHPFDVREILAIAEPGLDLGYELV